MPKLKSPLRVAQSKKKDFILNINNYRNAHYQTLNKVKINYKALMEAQIKSLQSFSKVDVTFTVFPKDKRKFDISNVCSIHDKFFMDALVEFGKLPDDTYEYIHEVLYQFGDIDKDNPRVEIEIKEYENSKSTKH